MVRKKEILALLLAVCLLVSSCGGGNQPASPSESQRENASLSQPGGPEPAPSENTQPSTPSPEPGTSDPEPQPLEGPAPEDAHSLPPEGPAGEDRSASQPEEAPSVPDPKPEVPPENPESPENKDPPPEGSSQPEAPPEPPEPPSQPEEPELLPQECRWLNITEVSVLGFINRERGKSGLTPLTLDADLTAAARVRAEELYRGNYVAHTRPGGAPWETVLTEARVEYARAAENLAWCNHGVGEEIGAFQWFDLWKDSPKHYKAMMDDQYTHCGVAILTGPYYDGEDQTYAVALFCTY